MHSGDNKTGVGDGDDELITIDPSAMPSNVVSCVVRPPLQLLSHHSHLSAAGV